MRRRRFICCLTPAALALAICAPALGQTKQTKAHAPAKSVVAVKAPAQIPSMNATSSRDQEQRDFTFGHAISRDDAERYRRIFDLQDNAHFHDADAEIARLGDRMLMGHVLAQPLCRVGRMARYL